MDNTHPLLKSTLDCFCVTVTEWLKAKNSTAPSISGHLMEKSFMKNTLSNTRERELRRADGFHFEGVYGLRIIWLRLGKVEDQYSGVTTPNRYRFSAWRRERRSQPDSSALDCHWERFKAPRSTALCGWTAQLPGTLTAEIETLPGYFGYVFSVGLHLSRLKRKWTDFWGWSQSKVLLKLNVLTTHLRNCSK